MIYFGLKKIIKMFRYGSVSVDGLRGRGKDMLMANVVIRRNEPYVSNINYGGKFIPLDMAKLDCGGNDYRSFLSGNIKAWQWPYPDKADIYISDAGVYLPAQNHAEISRLFPALPMVWALSRHLGDCSVHTNCQVQSRVYDKLREQSDQYIKCVSCRVIGKLVIQRLRIYERAQSCSDNVPPFPLRRPARNADRRLNYDLAFANYRIAHGDIKACTHIYFNRSNYDTRVFRTILGGSNA